MPARRFSPPVSILLLTFATLAGLFIGNLVGLALVLPLVDGFDQLTTLTTNPSTFPQGRMALLLLQGCAALCAFVVAPLAFLKWVEGQKVSSLNASTPLPPLALPVAALVTVTIMPVTAIFIRWNRNIDFPDAIERWVRGREDTLEALTNYLVAFETPFEVGMGFLVIAVLPAVGEELFFRGLLQPRFVRWSRNPHVGIWLTAVFFSFFHFQFYGFVPRMLIGALFGYLYHWSGHLSTAMIAHFTNNALTLLALYTYARGYSTLDPDTADEVPWTLSLLALAVTAGLLYWFRRSQSGAAEPDGSGSVEADGRV